MYVLKSLVACRKGWIKKIETTQNGHIFQPSKSLSNALLFTSEKDAKSYQDLAPEMVLAVPLKEAQKEQ
jgi:hypothetical protein